MKLRLMLLALLCGWPMMASAGSFGKLPALDGKRSDLQLRVVRYTGGTNGKMVVQVRNKTQRPVAFTAQGLYFVPQGDPEKAPQRLGAAGPFEAKLQGTWRTRKQLTLKAGEARTLRLQVYCIDSHRASPTARHEFRMANKRLPKSLRRQFKKTASKNYSADRGRIAPAAKRAIQHDVWKARNKKWIKLEGERADEKNSPSKGPGLERHHIRRMPQQHE